MKKKQTFAELTAQLPEPSRGEEFAWLSPIADGEYVDDAGARWSLRGGTTPVRRIEKLLVDPVVTVVHVHVRELREVPVEEREAFLAKIRPYLKGKQDPKDHTDFQAGEFKDESGRSLLVVEEFC